MKANQVDILKSQMIEVDNGRMMLVTLMYHTRKENDSPSFYKYIVNVDTKDNFEKLIESYKSESTANEIWSIPAIPGFECGMFKTKKEIANFISMKMKKARNWDEGLQILNGYKKTTKTFNENAKYQTTGYVDISSKKTFDINSLNTVKDIPNGSYLIYDVQLKRNLK